TSNAPSSAVIRSSVIERSHHAGVLVQASTVTIDRVVARDTAPQASDGDLGSGIVLFGNDHTGVGATGTIRSSLVERSYTYGVIVSGSSATIESTAIVETSPRVIDGDFGGGLLVQLEPPDAGARGRRADATLSWSLIGRNYQSGIGIFSSDLDIQGTLVTQTR